MTVTQSKAAIASIAGFALLLGTMTYRVVSHHHAREVLTGRTPSAIALGPTRETRGVTAVPPGAAPAIGPAASPATPEENAAYLEEYYNLDHRSHDDQDARGVLLTRRKTSEAVANSTSASPAVPETETPAAMLRRGSLRLQGGPRPRSSSSLLSSAVEKNLVSQAISPAARASLPARNAPVEGAHPHPQRFNPYGSVLKCELVFPLDSVNEQMPLIGLVMEPVYNNGRLVIPAGTEVHGTARPDRQRNRLFSGEQWVLVFPREKGLINGRQLSVRGVALDRVEPDLNGMTWGLGDGAYGIEGTVIRSMQAEEIKRFVATFLAAAAAGLQTRQGNAVGGESVQSTPRNAVLQGVSADMQQVATDIAAEIAQHGVFIHIPAGHQFYLYPTQIIDPDAAEISNDIATVK